MTRIRSAPIVPRAKSIRSDVGHDADLKFSFKHLDLTSNPKFGLAKCADGYLERFLGRLRDVSGMTVGQFRTSRSPSLKAHALDWASTSEKDGFTCLNGELRKEEAWQFEITRNAHGRVHGLLIRDTFYLVWLDPDHLMYP